MQSEVKCLHAHSTGYACTRHNTVLW